MDSSVKAIAINSRVDGLQIEDGSSSASLPSPLKRDLYLYLAVVPGGTGSVAECAFLRFITSTAGREILIEQGFSPGEAEASGVIKNVCP